MENQNKRFNKLELIVTIVAGLIIALGLAAAILGGYWIGHPIKESDKWVYIVLVVLGLAWIITSGLIVIGLVLNWNKKPMKIIGIISVCFINAVGLAVLLLFTKKKPATPTPVVVEGATVDTTSTQEVKPVE